MSERIDAVRSGSRTLPVRRAGTVVAELRAATPGDAELVAGWRDAHRRWFLSEFSMDISRTRRWIEDVNGSPNRILLMIAPSDTPDLAIGHLGLAQIDLVQGAVEVDNVLRGSEDHPGLMSASVRSLLDWVRETLGVPRVFLRVFADNPAVSFYDRIGFRVVGQENLRFVADGAGGKWEPGGDGPERRTLLTMALDLDLLAQG